MRTLIFSLFVLCSIVGCANPATTELRGLGEGAAKEGALSVSLRTMLLTDAGERSVAEGEILHTGDRVSFFVRTNQPAYVYLVLFGADGVPSTLWPSGPAVEQRVAANCPLRIPAQGSFYLQSPAGVEDLRLAASTVTLFEADRRLCQELGLRCAGPPASPAAPPPCPSASGRALFSAVKVATATARGVASLRVALRHDP